MSLCWKIYHFFHHTFSKNSNKPPQKHRLVIKIDIRRKKNCAKKCLFWPPRGCEKMEIFHTWHLQKKSFLFLRFFSGSVMCEKLPFFPSPAVVRKGTFLHNLFFSEYGFWSQVAASVIRIHIQRKTNCAKKCLFWPPRGWEKMVIFHTWHFQKKIILISSHFAIEPWDPWNTLPNSRRSDLSQKIQNSKKFEF